MNKNFEMSNLIIGKPSFCQKDLKSKRNISKIVDIKYNKFKSEDDIKTSDMNAKNSNVETALNFAIS